ncbi:MAG TPA: type III polyketide synthase [Polyangiaceae bacterium]|nr:type III polyketide synthase [Polyangiaceae bacterium]
MPNAATPRLPTLTRLSSAFPPLRFSQREIYDGLLRHWYAEVPNAWELMENVRVRHRHYAWDPREELAERSPGTARRMAAYKRAVLAVGGESLRGTLEGVDRATIGSFVMASCTGYTGPTPELLLARDVGLRADLRRTFIGHMGCYAAFNVLKTAMDSLAARPDEPVLVNCSEFSSLHYRPERTREQAVIHALFGDACASALVSMEGPGVGVQLVRSRTEQLYATHELMTWDVLDDGFIMTLSPYVPFVIAEHIGGLLGRLLGPEGLELGDVRHWVVHPGGPKILDVVGDKLRLTGDDLGPSYRVLEERGNCSSTTVLLVLEEVLRSRSPARGEYGVMLAFGPGLTMESMLVRF